MAYHQSHLVILSLEINEDEITANLSDSRSITIPTAWFRRLTNSSLKQLNNYEISPPVDSQPEYIPNAGLCCWIDKEIKIIDPQIINRLNMIVWGNFQNNIVIVVLQTTNKLLPLIWFRTVL